MKQITPWHDRTEVLLIPDGIDWNDSHQAIVDKAKGDEIAELRSALDTVQPVQVNEMLVEALEKLLPMARRHGTLFGSSNPWTEACDIGDAALTAAKQGGQQ